MKSVYTMTDSEKIRKCVDKLYKLKESADESRKTSIKFNGENACQSHYWTGVKHGITDAIMYLEEALS